MEDCSRCDCLPFSPPSQANRRGMTKPVSRRKLEKLRLHGFLSPTATAVGCAIRKLILVDGLGRRSTLSPGLRAVSPASSSVKDF